MQVQITLGLIETIKEFGMANGIHRKYDRDPGYGRESRYWQAYSRLAILFPNSDDIIRAMRIADQYYLRITKETEAA